MALSTQIKPDCNNIIGLTPYQFSILIEGLQQAVAGYKFIEMAELDQEQLIEVIQQSNELAGVKVEVNAQNIGEILEEFREKKFEAQYMISVLLKPNVNLN